MPDPDLPVSLDPLPAMPGDGTTKCGDDCHCEWSIRVIDTESEDYDANWRLGASSHCETCIKRGRNWVGIRVRGGELKTDVVPIFD